MTVSYTQRKDLLRLSQDNDIGLGALRQELALDATISELAEIMQQLHLIRCLACGHWYSQDNMTPENDVCQKCAQTMK